MSSVITIGVQAVPPWRTHNPRMKPNSIGNPRKARRTKLDAAKIRQLAVRAEVDPRSIERVLQGADVRGMAGERAKRILKEEGLL